MGINAAKNCAREILNILRVNDHVATATEIEAALANLDDPLQALESLKSIEGMCHIKWLGDLHINNMDFKAWLSQINKLRNACSKAFRELEKNC